METLDEVIENIYLGGIGAAKNTDQLKKLNIGAILTIDIQPLPTKFTNDFHYKYIYSQDSLNQNIIAYFDECIEFIEQHKPNKVLIHCFQGVSRSATILIAYLMKIHNYSLPESLEKISAKRLICPNSGFIKQLRIYKSSNCIIDTSNPVFKAFRLNQFAKNMLETYEFFSTNDMPSIFAIDPLFDGPDSSNFCKVYKCKQCRRALFYDTNCLTHTKSYGYLTFEYTFNPKDQNKEAEIDETCKDFLFIEPLVWMREQISAIISGKIHCPKCQAKLGSFNWAGEKCGCQSWVTPAFNIQKSKVDIH